MKVSTRWWCSSPRTVNYTSAELKALRFRDINYRLRYDYVGTDGKFSFRRAGRMHHLGVGAAHRGKRVMLLADDTTRRRQPPRHRRAHRDQHHPPRQDYWRNNEKEPGRRPDSFSE